MTQANDLIERGRATLRGNDRGGYTVPTAGLYPFQWNWDAGITALGWATFDEPRAWQELERLFEGQWENGMVAHIVFHAPADHYFPGPEVWGVKREPATSAITQPPLLATIVRIMYEQAQNKDAARNHAEALLPKLAKYHRYFYRDRDPQQTGLVASYHPWESGMDNSPAWDIALARVLPVQRSYQRRDLQYVDSDQRPGKSEYDRYIYLVAMFQELQFDGDAIYQKSPYKVQDVSLNSVLLRANNDLLALCKELDYQEELADLQLAGERARATMVQLWSDAHNGFLSRDLVSNELIPVRTTAGLMPLYAHAASQEQAQKMGPALNSWLDAAPLGIASTHPAESTFDSKRYWRGPTWLHINWMIAIGLEHYGLGEIATRVKQASRNLVEQSGYWEYFDSLDGQGCGGPDFSWTAAIALHWLLSPT